MNSLNDEQNVVIYGIQYITTLKMKKGKLSQRQILVFSLAICMLFTMCWTVDFSIDCRGIKKDPSSLQVFWLKLFSILVSLSRGNLSI